MPGFKNLKTERGEIPVVDVGQDDDVESDNEVVQNGIEISIKDLLVVRNLINMHRDNPDRIRCALKTYRMWAHLFPNKHTRRIR